MAEELTALETKSAIVNWGFDLRGKVIMRLRLVKTLISVTVVLCLPQVSLADLTIKMKIKEGAHAEHVMTMRFKGRRQLNEFEGLRGAKFAWLYQCDKKQVVGINFAEKRSFVHSVGLTLNASMAFNEPQLDPLPARNSRSGGKLTQTVIVTDTGERREMFGFQARRIKTSTIWEAAPACKQNRLRAETDGWYVDLLYGVECSADLSGFWNQAFVAPRSKCDEHYNKNKYEFENKQIGTARFGFPLLLTRKFYGDSGQPVINYEEVVELSTAELDQSLFEAPSDFVQTSDSTSRDYRPTLFERVFSFMRRR